MLAQNDRHQECMRVLKRLAQEIANMNEHERLEDLECMIKLELEGRGNPFWRTISKRLLSKPELLQSVIKFAEREITGQTNVKYVNFEKGIIEKYPALDIGPSLNSPFFNPYV